MAGNDDILSVKDLSFSYNRQRILDNISFTVKQGSFVSVLGPNGAGKSTLVNVLSKVLKDFQGTISVGGRDIGSMTSRELARMVAVVPQYATPSFSFSVEEMVMMGRYPYGSRFGGETRKDLKVVKEVMEKTRTGELAGKRFNQLSGGEKQRVIVAQALAQDSPILLLDEPTSHLDINFQIEFMNLFTRLNREEGKTVIGIFHDINLAIQNDSLIMLLKEGSIFGFGKAEEIINRQNLRSVFHSDVFVGKNPVTGKIYVSPVFDPGYGIRSHEKDRGEKKSLKIHIIGGGGAATPVLNLLHHHGYQISCGVINTFDSDLSTCQMLDIPYIVEAPFSPISLDSQNKNLGFIKTSDVVILPEVEFGNGNFSNLVSVREALKLKKKVLVMDNKDIKARDHTGGKAEGLYCKILDEGAQPVSTGGQMLDILKGLDL